MDWAERWKRLERRSWVALLGAALVLLLAAGAGAQEHVDVEVTLVRVSDAPGGVAKGARAKRYDALLRGQVAYQSLEVVRTEGRKLAPGKLWELALPTGAVLSLRALDVSEEGTLLSVDLEGSVQGDFKVRRGHPLILGGPPFRDGKLVIGVETR